MLAWPTRKRRPKKPPRQQARITTVGKLFSVGFLVGFVLLATVLGVVIGPFITPLGIFLNARAIIQIILAQLNNHRFIKAIGQVLIDGLIQTLKEAGIEDEKVSEKLQNLVGKKLTIDEFLNKVEKIVSPLTEVNRGLWDAVAVTIINTLNAQGKDVDLPIDANVPVYKVSIKELQDCLESLKNQLFPFRRIWIVLNDPKNQELRDWINWWITNEREETQYLFATNQIDEETRAWWYDRWVFLDLPAPGKRRAMASAWLAQFGLDVSRLEEVLDEMFNNPDRPLALGKPETGISLNVDSDTTAQWMASFITYLSFVMFGLGGLTSNVRVRKEMYAPADATLFQRFSFWFLKWETYFKYDFANNVERAAESFFYCVVCMSGPWMGLRTSTIPVWIGRFANFVYQGVIIGPGDDRKATYEENALKQRVAYNPWVVTYTDAPETWARMRSIQSRWIMSFYANFFTSVREGQIFLLHTWSILDQLYGAAFTFIILGVFGRLAVQVWNISRDIGGTAALHAVLPYFVVFVTVNFLRGVYSAWDNKDLKGLLTAFYVVIVFLVLVPVKFTRLFILGIAEKGYIWQGRAAP